MANIPFFTLLSQQITVLPRPHGGSARLRFRLTCSLYETDCPHHTYTKHQFDNEVLQIVFRWRWIKHYTRISICIDKGILINTETGFFLTMLQFLAKNMMSTWWLPNPRWRFSYSYKINLCWTKLPPVRMLLKDI